MGKVISDVDFATVVHLPRRQGRLREVPPAIAWRASSNQSITPLESTVRLLPSDMAVAHKRNGSWLGAVARTRCLGMPPGLQDIQTPIPIRGAGAKLYLRIG